MHALAGERVQIGRQGRDQRLALAGAHLGDLAVVQRDSADQLHVEVAHFERALGRLTHDRKRLGQQVIERRTFADALLELVGLGAQLRHRTGARSRARAR